MTNTLNWKKKTLWDLKKIAGLPIYGQVYDEYTPWNEELYGFDEISKEKYHSECARELFAKYQRLALRNQYTKVDHHVWVQLRDRPHSLIEPRRKVCQRRPTSILPQVQRHNMLEKKKSLLLRSPTPEFSSETT